MSTKYQLLMLITYSIAILISVLLWKSIDPGINALINGVAGVGCTLFCIGAIVFLIVKYFLSDSTILSFTLPLKLLLVPLFLLVLTIEPTRLVITDELWLKLAIIIAAFGISAALWFKTSHSQNSDKKSSTSKKLKLFWPLPGMIGLFLVSPYHLLGEIGIQVLLLTPQTFIWLAVLFGLILSMGSYVYFDRRYRKHKPPFPVSNPHNVHLRLLVRGSGLVVFLGILFIFVANARFGQLTNLAYSLFGALLLIFIGLWVLATMLELEDHVRLFKKYQKYIPWLLFAILSVIGALLLSTVFHDNLDFILFLHIFSTLGIIVLFVFRLSHDLSFFNETHSMAGFILLYWFATVLILYLYYMYRPLYFYELTPPASIMTAVVLYSFYDRSRNRTEKSQSLKRNSHRYLLGTSKSLNVFVTFFIILSMITASLFLVNTPYFKVSEGEDVKYWYGEINPYMSTVTGVADYLRSHTSQDEEIMANAIYAFQADRDNIFHIIYWPSYTPLAGFGHYSSRGYPSPQEIVEYLDNKSIRYVVVDTMMYNFVLLTHRDLREYIIGNPQDNVEPHYVMVEEIDGVQILLRKEYL